MKNDFRFLRLWDQTRKVSLTNIFKHFSLRGALYKSFSLKCSIYRFSNMGERSDALNAPLIVKEGLRQFFMRLVISRLIWLEMTSRASLTNILVNKKTLSS